jgi:hypothetical protein
LSDGQRKTRKTFSDVHVVGIDPGKTPFDLVGLDATGKIVNPHAMLPHTERSGGGRVVFIVRLKVATLPIFRQGSAGWELF